MRPKLRNSLRSVFNVTDLLPFFIGALTLTLIQDSFYKLLEDNVGRFLGKNVSPAIWIFLLASIVLFVYVRVRSAVDYRTEKLRRSAPTAHKQTPHKHKGLILLVSNVIACRTAIEWHLPKLECCWLICSEQTSRNAQELRQEYPQQCSPALVVIDDVNDPIEFQTKINDIYQQLPSDWQESDIVADYTGMTAHASVGMALACFNTDRSLQYTPALRNSKGKVIDSVEPIEIVLEPTTAKTNRSKKRFLWFGS